MELCIKGDNYIPNHTSEMVLTHEMLTTKIDHMITT